MRYLITIILSIIVSFLSYQFFAQQALVYTNSDTSLSAPTKRVVDLENFGLQDLENELIDTVNTVKDSVVSILVTKDFVMYDGRQASGLIKQQIWWGSGIVVSPEWYILTNKHVVDDPDASYTVMFADGETAQAAEAWLDPTLDIAVLKVEKSLLWDRTIAQAVPFGQQTQVWQFVLAIGNALAEFSNSVTFGVISGKNRKLTLDNENLYAWLLQTDTSISEWNSWGPLFDLDGNVVGINTAVSSLGENIGFAIPISQEFVTATLSAIQKYDALTRPFVWVRYIDLSIEVARELDIDAVEWVYVAEVVDGTPADMAGIRPDDIITHIDWLLVDMTNPFLYQLFTKSPGDTVEITVNSEWISKVAQLVLSNQ